MLTSSPIFPEINYGSRLRAGVLVPSGNSVAEPELRAMLPPEVSLLVTRLSLRGSSQPELMRMLDQLEAASTLLADAEVEVIVFHCTAASTFAPDMAEAIQERIKALGTPKLALNRIETLEAFLPNIEIQKHIVKAIELLEDKSVTFQEQLTTVSAQKEAILKKYL